MTQLDAQVFIIWLSLCFITMELPYINKLVRDRPRSQTIIIKVHRRIEFIKGQVVHSTLRCLQLNSP